MDEAFDQWRFMKVDYDYSIYFEKYYEEDVSAMIRKDISHPSVIMYSIGNEIGDTGSDEGAVWNRILLISAINWMLPDQLSIVSIQWCP